MGLLTPTANLTTQPRAERPQPVLPSVGVLRAELAGLAAAQPTYLPFGSGVDLLMVAPQPPDEAIGLCVLAHGEASEC